MVVHEREARRKKTNDAKIDKIFELQSTCGSFDVTNMLPRSQITTSRAPAPFTRKGAPSTTMHPRRQALRPSGAGVKFGLFRRGTHVLCVPHDGDCGAGLH